MLNPFPQLLVYGFFAPTLLRVVVALVFAYIALRQWKKRDEFGETNFFIIGKGMWIVWFSIGIEALVAAGLFLGLYTQVAALLGALLAIKSYVWRGRYPVAFPLSRMVSLLLAVICLSLIFSGAGALAFDLPL